MNIETLCITDVRSAVAIIAIHRRRDPKLKTLMVPVETWVKLWDEIKKGSVPVSLAHIVTQNLVGNYWTHILTISGVEIHSTGAGTLITHDP